MPEKDISRMTVERAVAVIQRTRAAFRLKMPYGPTKVKLTAREASRLAQKTSPEQLLGSMSTPDYLRTITEEFYGTPTANDSRFPF